MIFNHILKAYNVDQYTYILVYEKTCKVDYDGFVNASHFDVGA